MRSSGEERRVREIVDRIVDRGSDGRIRSHATLKAIAVHHTDTVDKPWDGPANKASLKDNDIAAFRQAFAWYDAQGADPDGDGYPDAKADWKFVHHEVSADGKVGAANVQGCRSGINNLNGARTPPDIPAADRQGVYNHLAAHMRDAKVKPPELTRATENRERLAATLVPETADPAKREIDVQFYSGVAVERFDFWTGARYSLEFSMEPDHVRMDRLNSGAPLLNSHWSMDLSDVIGVVQKGWLDGKTGKARVKFSGRADVAPIWQDVQDGIIRNISMGAAIHKLKDITPRPADERVPLPKKKMRAIDWEPMEISPIPIGADPGAGFLSAQLAAGMVDEWQGWLPSADEVRFSFAELPERPDVSELKSGIYAVVFPDRVSTAMSAELRKQFDAVLADTGVRFVLFDGGPQIHGPLASSLAGNQRPAELSTPLADERRRRMKTLLEKGD